MGMNHMYLCCDRFPYRQSFSLYFLSSVEDGAIYMMKFSSFSLSQKKHLIFSLNVECVVLHGFELKNAVNFKQ